MAAGPILAPPSATAAERARVAELLPWREHLVAHAATLPGRDPIRHVLRRVGCCCRASVVHTCVGRPDAPHAPRVIAREFLCCELVGLCPWCAAVAWVRSERARVALLAKHVGPDVALLVLLADAADGSTLPPDVQARALLAALDPLRRARGRTPGGAHLVATYAASVLRPALAIVGDAATADAIEGGIPGVNARGSRLVAVRVAERRALAPVRASYELARLALLLPELARAGAAEAAAMARVLERRHVGRAYGGLPLAETLAPLELRALEVALGVPRTVTRGRCVR